MCALVESAMLQLPPKYRVVLVLRDMEQLSGADTAAALGLDIRNESSAVAGAPDAARSACASPRRSGKGG